MEASGGNGVAPDLTFTQVAASAEITDTADETEFDQQVVIPANMLKIGSRLHVRMGGFVGASNGFDTLLLRLRLGSVILVTTAAVDTSANDIWAFDAVVVMRATGALASGILLANYQNPDAPNATPRLTHRANILLNTTIANTLRASALWSAANAGNTVRQDMMNVRLLSD